MCYRPEYYDIIRASLERLRIKGKKHALKCLKCLKKNLLLQCHFTLNRRRDFFHQKHLANVFQKVFNRVFTMSSF